MTQYFTKATLVATARELFARQGFRGTTIRAIADGAGANLGAVTYHFGSKRALYHAVIEQATAPMREKIRTLDPGAGPAIDTITQLIRTMFAFLAENPDVPSLVMQQLVTSDPLPPAARRTMASLLDGMSHLIQRGQREGNIRAGTPRFMAVSFALIPMAHAIYRRALQEAAGIDQREPAIREEMEHEVIMLIRRGLAAQPAPDGEST